MTLDSVIGRGSYLDCREGRRDSDNTLIYPDHVIGQSIYDAGRVIAGFHWDVLQGFMQQYGTDEGKKRAAELWHRGRVLEQPRTQPDQVIATFVADDTDGNLLNGTEHYQILCQAARNHNFHCMGGDMYVAFWHQGDEDGSFHKPYNTLGEGVRAVWPFYPLIVKSGRTDETMIIRKPMRIEAYGGSAILGAQ